MILKLLERLLKLLAQGILWRYQPKVIAVAGSVGKTSAKEAIFQVVSSSWRSRRAQGSYNNEIGVPLTIIGCVAYGKNFFGWLYVLAKGSWLLLGYYRYPEVLVLELGEDKAGDVEYLMNLIKPQVGVLTAIEKVHMEFFKSLEVVAKECSAVVRLLSPESTAVLNIDNRQVAMYRESLIARTLTVGRDSEADVRAESVVIMTKDECLGLKINISYQQSVFPIFLRGVVAQHQVYAVLTASAVGLALGMKMIDIGNALESYQPPKGRVIIIDGWRGSTLIDDTYNSSPAAALAALTTLSQIPIRKKGKRVAVLGDMLELGDYTESGHRLVGQQVVPAKVDLLVTVGKLSKAIAIGAREAGLAEAKLRSFTDQGEAIDFLKDIIVQNDVVLLKGSQSARIERVVKALMKNPDQAGDLLVRQSKRWLRK